jgi:hypothetical protein
MNKKEIFNRLEEVQSLLLSLLEDVEQEASEKDEDKADWWHEVSDVIADLESNTSNAIDQLEVTPE